MKAIVIVLALVIGTVVGWTGHIAWIQFVVSQELDRRQFDEVFRASKALDSAAKVGVNIQKFTDLVQNLATEISVTKGRVKSQEDQKLLSSFNDVFNTYNDALILWRAELSSADRLYAKDAGKIIAGKKEITVAKNYGFPVEKIELFDTHQIADALPVGAVSRLLVIAGKLVEQANSTSDQKR